MIKQKLQNKMEQLETTKKMYSEIMKPLHKYKGLCVFDIEELESK